MPQSETVVVDWWEVHPCPLHDHAPLPYRFHVCDTCGGPFAPKHEGFTTCQKCHYGT